MKFGFKKLTICLSALFLIASTLESGAFALLGPVQPWMQTTNGVISPGDIGGPMCINNGYRWNVPVVTYGFDQSFLNYFGSNGVAAVESAIQILNDLPPASQIVLTNYPFNSQNLNYAAQAQSLLDLKSQTLSLLLEHLGLAQPTRNVYVLHDWDPSFFTHPSQYIDITIVGMPVFYESDPYGIDPETSGGTPGYVTNFIAGFNFDPETFDPNVYVNNTEYAGYILCNTMGQTFIEPFAVNPFNNTYTAVADFNLNTGGFYIGLTYDDVGGLCYLFSTNNVNYETLLSGVVGVGTNANSFVNGAWRPGVDKITFIPQPVDSQSGAFLPTTNCFADSYITNGILQQQQMARIISQPDFLFSAGTDTFRTGTTNWINNAALNNNPAGGGPGIIRPPVVIAFQKMGSYFYSTSSYTYPVIWSEDSVQDISSFFGTFDGSTNAPIFYPVPQTGNVSMVVRVLLRHSNFAPNNFESFEWSPTSQAGTIYALQTSTNLSTWNSLFAVTNNSSVCTYQNVNANSSSRFYRLIPQ